MLWFCSYFSWSLRHSEVLKTIQKALFAHNIPLMSKNTDMTDINPWTFSGANETLSLHKLHTQYRTFFFASRRLGTLSDFAFVQNLQEKQIILSGKCFILYEVVVPRPDVIIGDIYARRLVSWHVQERVYLAGDW